MLMAARGVTQKILYIFLARKILKETLLAFCPHTNTYEFVYFLPQIPLDYPFKFPRNLRKVKSGSGSKQYGLEFFSS